MTVRVSNREELKKAAEQEADEIIVEGDFCKKILKLTKLFSMTPQKRNMLIGLICGACAFIIAEAVTILASAPVSGGASALLGSSVIAGQLALLSIKTGIGISILALLVWGCAYFGSALIKSLLSYYDLDNIDGIIRFIRKKKENKPEEHENPESEESDGTQKPDIEFEIDEDESLEAGDCI